MWLVNELVLTFWALDELFQNIECRKYIESYRVVRRRIDSRQTDAFSRFTCGKLKQTNFYHTSAGK